MSRKQPDIFTKFTTATATLLGRPWVFVIALLSLVIWGVSGPLVGFSDTWQLIINTATTIITFLMVFIIQNTQNRDNLALNLKLDALLKAANLDERDLLQIEDESDKELEHKKQEEVP
jgi:low affinity Fe/Cu permease